MNTATKSPVMQGWFLNRAGDRVSLYARSAGGFAALVERHLSAGGMPAPDSPDVALTPTTRLHVAIRFAAEVLKRHVLGAGNSERLGYFMGEAARHVAAAKGESPNDESIARAERALEAVRALVGVQVEAGP